MAILPVSMVSTHLSFYFMDLYRYFFPEIAPRGILWFSTGYSTFILDDMVDIFRHKFWMKNADIRAMGFFSILHLDLTRRRRAIFWAFSAFPMAFRTSKVRTAHPSAKRGAKKTVGCWKLGPLGSTEDFGGWICWLGMKGCIIMYYDDTYLALPS